MAGILDFLNSDDGRLGIALLGAAGPSMQPMGFGQRLQGAMQSLDANKENQLKMGLMQAQTSGALQQQQLQALQLQQQQQQWKLQQPLLQSFIARLNGGQGGPQGGADGGSPQMSQPASQPTPGGALGSGTFGIPTGGQMSSGPVGAGGGVASGGGQTMLPGVPDNIAAINIATGGMGSIPGLVNEYNKPTDLQKLLAAGGYTQEQQRAAILDNIKKQNYIAPVNARPGSILRDPTTNRPVAFNPQVPEGSTPVFDASGNVIALQPLKNAADAIAGLSGAKKSGEAEAQPTVAFDASGNPVFSTAGQDLRRAQGAGGAPTNPFLPSAMRGGQLSQPGDADRTAIYQGEMQDAQARLAAAKTPAEANRARNDVAGLTREMQANKIPLTPQLRPGVAQGAQLGQDELSKKWQTLTQANSEAQNTRSYLDSIKQLSTTAATGKFTDKLQLINSLLSPFSVSAMDATTANNLLDKYSNQIVARLGGGGMGTDAARSILQSAYPNAHMTPDAIAEAVDNIKGAQSMTQAKARLLQQAANARDPAQYNQREVAFDQAADPRVWQLNEMPADKQAEYVKKLPASVAADLLKRRQTLRQLGAF